MRNWVGGKSCCMKALGAILSLLILVNAPVAVWAHDNLATVVGKVKPAIVAIASYNPLRQPQAEILGTGFGVANGQLVVTNEQIS